MEVPLQITFNNMQRSDAIEAKIRGRAEKLERYCTSLIGCRVAVEAPHQHHRAGNQFLVRVEVNVPGKTLIATREPDSHHAYTDVYVAIRDAFDSIRRQLEEYGDRRRAQTTDSHGVVTTEAIPIAPKRYEASS